MRYIFTYLTIGLLITACSKTEQECEITVEAECVSVEEISSTETGFLVLNKGLQENGYAQGIKINEEFETSAFLRSMNDLYSLTLISYWKDSLSNQILTGELLRFGPFFDIQENTCYFLSPNESSQDSIQCSYRVNHGDVNILVYELDTNADNQLEVIEFDEENKTFKGRFKAFFITSNPRLPAFPERVRFFNTDVVIGE